MLLREFYVCLNIFLLNTNLRNAMHFRMANHFSFGRYISAGCSCWSNKEVTGILSAEFNSLTHILPNINEKEKKNFFFV
jgi:hypothetical protein